MFSLSFLTFLFTYLASTLPPSSHHCQYPYRCGNALCNNVDCCPPSNQALLSFLTVMPKDKRYPCPQPDCTKSFAQERSAKAHVLRDHSETPRKMFPCPEASCISTFLSRPGLQKHLLLEHQGFICKLSGCRLQFADKGALENHTRTHTRLECAHVGCERSYTDRDGLQKHIGKMHGGVSGSEVTKIIPPAPEPFPGSPGGKWRFGLNAWKFEVSTCLLSTRGNLTELISVQNLRCARRRPKTEHPGLDPYGKLNLPCRCFSCW